MKLSIRQPARLAWLALLLAAGAMLLSASGAQAASKRGAVLVKDIWPGRGDSVTEPDCGCGEMDYAGGDLTNVGGTLYFSAQDGTHGYELWRSDGTRKGTRMVKDIHLGEASYGAASSNIDGITAVNRILYFRADDGVHGAELWRSDGTALGTRMVKDMKPAGSSYPGGLINVGGALYFYADDGSGRGLWRSDGTEAGTVLVKGFGSLAESSLLTDVGGTLYFALSAGEAHTEIWRSDGTPAGTGLVKQGFVGELKFTDFRGTLYFLGDEGTRAGLWRSDGTEAGTAMVKDINPYPPSPWLDCVKSCFTKLRHTLYFLWSDGAIIGNEPNELWRSDGTEAGTSLLKRANGFFLEPTAVKGDLYLSDRHALWRSDGTRRGTKLVRKFDRGYYRPQSLTAVKTRLYFAAADKRHGEELWRSDGTRKGVRMVWDIRRGEIGGTLRNLTAVGNTLFFTAEDSATTHGEELWRVGPKLCKTAKGKCKKKKIGPSG